MFLKLIAEHHDDEHGHDDSHGHESKEPETA